MYPRQLLAVSLVLGALLLGLVFPGVAKSVAPDLCFGGDTYGAWDLPSGDEPGQATGVLVIDQSGDPFLTLNAELTEPSHPLEFRTGEIVGTLATPSGTPLYRIAGTWRTNPRDDYNGTWQAIIYHPNAPESLGMIIAEFAGQEGTYSGTWVICERP
jgi:hypothetical protein